MTSLLFSPPPYHHRESLRREALAALQKGDRAAFELACSNGWSPLLHDSAPESSTVSRLARDLGRLTGDNTKPLSLGALRPLFERFPEVIWELAWRSPGASWKGRGAELESLWKKMDPALKELLAPSLPAEFFGSAEAPRAEHIESVALNFLYGQDLPASAALFNGFFQSPAWRDALARLEASGQTGHALHPLLSVKAHLCVELANRLKSNATIQADRLRECVEALDRVINPIANGRLAAASPAAIAAAYYCLSLDQPEPLMMALSNLPAPERGDAEALKTLQSRAAPQCELIISDWKRRLGFLEAKAGAERSSRIHEPASFEPVLDRPLPWRSLAAKKRSLRCLRALEEAWGPPPDAIAAVGKSSVFRPPAGIQRHGAFHIARAASSAQAQELTDFFLAQAAHSARAISFASLPEELRAVLLAGRPESALRLAEPFQRPAEECEAKKYDKNLAQALRRARAGQSFVLSHPVAFGWGAFSLALGAPPEALLEALPTGGLAQAAQQIETLLDKTVWAPSTRALIEQDALALSMAPLARSSRPGARL